MLCLGPNAPWFMGWSILYSVCAEEKIVFKNCGTFKLWCNLLTDPYLLSYELTWVVPSLQLTAVSFQWAQSIMKLYSKRYKERRVSLCIQVKLGQLQAIPSRMRESKQRNLNHIRKLNLSRYTFIFLEIHCFYNQRKQNINIARIEWLRH